VVEPEYDDVERLSMVVEAYVDGVPGPATDEDRTREFAYNGVNQVTSITAKASDNDQVTAYDYGVIKGTDNSTVSSNDLLKTIRFPDPDPIPAPPGQPSLDADDQEVFGYNAHAERELTTAPSWRILSFVLIASCGCSPSGAKDVLRLYNISVTTDTLRAGDRPFTVSVSVNGYPVLAKASSGLTANLRSALLVRVFSEFRWPMLTSCILGDGEGVTWPCMLGSI
jgi:hypothetical protein